MSSFGCYKRASCAMWRSQSRAKRSKWVWILTLKSPHKLNKYFFALRHIKPSYPHAVLILRRFLCTTSIHTRSCTSKMWATTSWKRSLSICTRARWMWRRAHYQSFSRQLKVLKWVSINIFLLFSILTLNPVNILGKRTHWEQQHELPPLQHRPKYFRYASHPKSQQQ